MQCDRIREAASARLDGEPIGMSASVLDAHLADCPRCAAWLADATRLTRALRLTSADIPDLSGAILLNAALPAARVRRRCRLLVAGLAVVGILQILLALPDLFGFDIDMAMGMHVAHESAAFNIAVGIGLLGVARRPARAAALLPMVLVLVTLLAVLGARDLLAGAVPVGRLATHLSTLLGLGLLFALHRSNEKEPPEYAEVHGRGDGEAPAADDGGIRGVA
ncbi:Predicted anti-sigma-YlaC factor YlaD, contains Zn-finger domain [Frankineae bacterium MT45]|nr:Predicted anti-sigma-YlaC factor YlaD, contains Zn-finger domain [Frankineae bacterium MT45]